MYVCAKSYHRDYLLCCICCDVTFCTAATTVVTHAETGEDELDAADCDDNRYSSCKRLLESPIMSAAFAKHVERNLCIESLQFLRETAAYTAAATAALQQQKGLDPDASQIAEQVSAEYTLSKVSRV